MSGQKKDLIPVMGLWMNEGASGKYLSGKLGNMRVLIFPNTRKEEGSKQPDYRVFFAAEQQQPKAQNEDAEPVPF